MLRLSNYAIFVDVPDGDVLLVQGYSGAWDLVSSEVAGWLRQFRGKERFKPLAGNFDDDAVEIAAPAGEVEIPEQLLDSFVRRGYLTELTPEDEQQEVAKLAVELHEIASSEPPSYVFTLTYDCNLRCAYCFQDSLRTNPANAPKLVTMSTEMVDRIFSAMPEVEARHVRSLGSNALQTRKITLFGGEPLLGKLRPLVAHVVKRAQQSPGTSIAAITNGTELQYFTDLIGPQGISFLQITLDGSRSEHDRRRVGSLGLPTFDLIADNIDLALELKAQVKVRVNVDISNVQSLPDLAETIVTRGWTERDNLSVYVTPVHESAGSSGHEACGFGSLSLTRKMAELADLHANMSVFESSDSPLKRRVRQVLRGAQDPLLSFQPSFCGAHTRVWVFDALGDIYACWERAGDGVSRIGRLSTEGKLMMNPPALKVWRERTVASNPVCKRCPFAFYCGGGCALLAEMRNGTLHSNYCDDFAKRFQAIAIEELRALQHHEIIHSFAESKVRYEEADRNRKEEVAD